jgi:hypothetical protein
MYVLLTCRKTQRQGQKLDWTTTASFQILSNSLFTKHTEIWRLYILRNWKRRKMNNESYTIFLFCRIWGSPSGGYEEWYLLGYKVVYSVESKPMFRRNISTHLQGWKNNLSKKSLWKQVASIAYFSTLKIEVIYSSETSVEFQQTTRGYVPEDYKYASSYFVAAVVKLSVLRSCEPTHRHWRQKFFGFLRWEFGISKWTVKIINKIFLKIITFYW